MSTELQASPPRRKTSPRATFAALAVVGVLAVIVGVIWSTGGFGTDAKPFLGTQVAPGVTISTRFWDVAVHEAEVYEDKGEIRVSITATNKQRSSGLGMETGLVVVRLPDGTPLFGSSCDSQRGLRFGPLIPTEAVCVFRYEGESIPSEAVPGPGTFDIEVVVRDQEMSDNLLTEPEPAAGEPAAWIPLSVSVHVEEES